jgi:hypothetical protein
MQQNSALTRLDVLIGEWESESPQFPGAKGHTTLEWIEDGAFVLLRDAVPEPAPSGSWIIGADDNEQGLTVLHHDLRGVHRVYRMAFGDGCWRVWRDAPGFSQRFTGTLDPDGATLLGSWEKSVDGASWEHDFDLIYRRIT